MKTKQEKLDYINKECNTDYTSLEEVVWSHISEAHVLSEEFIREFKDNVYWYWISKCQKLSKGFIIEFANEVDWYCISTYQKLTEDFIREFVGKLNWNSISKYQKLSEEFIREYQDKVDWEYISMFQKLSDNFIEEFQDKLGYVYLKSWLYENKKILKQYIIGTGLYECYDDYFIAYKNIRSDRYSHYNFQYQYLPGETYEAHCDCTDKENSFGLSVWTEQQAREYFKGLIIKVKVNYEDVGRVVLNGGKIRCRKITILN